VNREALVAANYWFMSEVDDRGRREACDSHTPGCFHFLWPVLCSVSPLLRGCIRHLTQQDVDDFIFSLSREYARQCVSDV
jgi:hypothetical protein